MADLTVTAASCKPAAGAVSHSGVAGVAITQGQPVAIDSATGKLIVAVATPSASVAQVVGIATSESTGDGQPIQYQSAGWLEGMGTTEGLIYLLSGTAGGISAHTDVTTPVNPEFTSILGIGGPNSELIIGIQNSTQQVA